MEARPSIPASDEVAPAGFAPTEWSIVLDAKPGSQGRRQALERLCATYWPPVYAYLRRRGHSPADAEDLTQSFFVHVLESDFLERPDPAKGRFRGYLVGALKHFVGHHFERKRAQKRGGGVRCIEWTSQEAEREFAALAAGGQDAAEVYETSWALTLLHRALQRLEEEQTGAERAARYAALKPFLTATPTPGDYDEAARRLGTTRTTVAVWVHRLNQRYAELVRLEIAATVRDPTEIAQEMTHLAQALRR